jgi:hypothetical protein
MLRQVRRPRDKSSGYVWRRNAGRAGVASDDAEAHDRHMSAAKLPLAPKNPERVCWGCNRYCPADDMVCGNGTIRAPHPIELFGEDWLDTGDFTGLAVDADQDDAPR